MARKKITVHRKGYTRWSDGTYVKPSTYTKYVETNDELKEVGMKSPMGRYATSLPDDQRHKILKSLVQKAQKGGRSRKDAEYSVLTNLQAIQEVRSKRRQPSSVIVGGDIEYFYHSILGKKEKYRQISAGKRTIRGIHQDAKLKAKMPGKRKSKTGRIYYERRDNRSDRRPRSKKGLRI